MTTFSAHPKSVRPLYTGAEPHSRTDMIDPPRTVASSGRAVAPHRAKPHDPDAAVANANVRRVSLLSHGGKRQRAGATRGLSAHQAKRIVQAGIASIVCDMPFNRFVTIHWGALGLGDNLALQATSRLVTLARDWLRDRGVTAVYLWVRENDDGDGSKGAHVHWLVHVPDDHRTAFLARLKGWCVTAAGASRYSASALMTRPIGRHVDTWANAPDTHCANLRAVLAYVLKGLDDKAMQVSCNGLDAVWQGYGAALPNPGTGGVVIGKRVGVSRVLGKFTVCAREGFDFPSTSHAHARRGPSEVYGFTKRDR